MAKVKAAQKLSAPAKAPPLHFTSDDHLRLRDVAMYQSHKAISMLSVHETEKGLFLTVRMHWSGPREWFVSTLRSDIEPRFFINLATLNRTLVEILPDISFTLYRNQSPPVVKQSPPRSKQSSVWLNPFAPPRGRAGRPTKEAVAARARLAAGADQSARPS